MPDSADPLAVVRAWALAQPAGRVALHFPDGRRLVLIVPLSHSQPHRQPSPADPGDEPTEPPPRPRATAPTPPKLRPAERTILAAATGELVRRKVLIARAGMDPRDSYPRTCVARLIRAGHLEVIGSQVRKPT